MNTKSIVQTTLLFSLILLFTGCFSGEDTEVSFYKDKFKVLRPGSWSNQKDLNDNAQLQVGNAFKEAYAVVIVEEKSDLGNMDLVGYSNLTKGFLTAALTDLNEKAPENIKINGYDAIRREFSGTVSGVDAKYWHVSVENENNLTQMILWSLQDRFASNKGDFEKFMNSFQQAN